MLPVKTTLDGGEVVWFGQDQSALARQYSFQVLPEDLPISRPGIDTVGQLKSCRLRFDTGRLRHVEFDHTYRFGNPVCLYPEPWQNCDPIEGVGIRAGMSRHDFLDYLKKWVRRARAAGARSKALDDMPAGWFAIGCIRESFYNAIHVNLGPTRRAGGGGIWCSAWSVGFTTSVDPKLEDGQTDRLESLRAFSDEFNTVARRPGGGSSDRYNSDR